ncbi:MAG: hypothetical protein ACMXYD_04985 [Candidatus Woesearchaeota archaeon]
MELVLGLVVLHVIGAIIAVGGATMNDALFFRMIKNRRIILTEYLLLHQAGKIIWGGLALAVLAGLALLHVELAVAGRIARLGLPFFQMKLLLVAVIIINGVVFHTRVLPFIRQHLGENMQTRVFVEKYWLFALTGSISMVSWWGVILLALINPQLPFLYLLTLYLAAITFASVLSFLLFTQQLFTKDTIPDNYGVLPSVLKFAGVGVLIIAAVFLLSSINTDSPTTHYVCVLESPPWFDPPVLNIQPGDTVVWQHCDEPSGAHNPVHTHPIEQIAGPEYFSSGFGLVGQGHNNHSASALPYEYTFTEEGENTYICPTHPYMMGIVSVGEVSEATVWPKPSSINQSIVRNPEIAGVGEVWLNAQFSIIEGQDFPGSISVLNTETWKVEKVITHETFNNPHNPWNTYDERYVFQTQWHADTINKIDVESREVVASKQVGNAPAHLFVHPHEELLYVTMNNEDRVGVYDFNLTHLRDIQTNFGAHGIWIDPQGRYMAVAATLAEKLDIVDLSTEEVVASFEAEGFPLGVQITHDGKYAMINLLLEGKTRFVDLDTLEVVADVDVGELPIWAMPDPNNEYVFVTNTGTADITVIELATLEVVTTLEAGAGAHGIIFGENAAGGYYGYVSHKYEPYIGVVDLESLETIAYIKLEEHLIGGNGILVLPSTYTRWIS